jgi:YVTN family beta-propeller protein
MKGGDMSAEMKSSKPANMTKSPDHPSAASLAFEARSGHPYLYVVGANGTAIIDPSNWQVIVTAPRIPPGTHDLIFDNHYPDHLGRVWSVASAEEDGSALAAVHVVDPKTLTNAKTISLGQNVAHTPGLTPDRKFAVVPVSSENKLHVYDTNTFEKVAMINVGAHPWDMMVSADGKYCCEPDMDSDTLTIIDPHTWKVIGTVPTGEGTGPFMVTIWPDNHGASVECSGHHGAEYHHLGPPAVPTGKGFSVSFVDLRARSVIKSIPLDFLAVWDEFTPDGKYNFFFGSEDAKVVVVDTATLEVVRTIALESKPTLNGYITPDPNGKYLYASVETGLQVIDTSSLQVVETIRIGGVVGTPFLLK